MRSSRPPDEPGEQLPEVNRVCNLVQAVMFAGASENYHRPHYDHDFARSEGLPCAIVASGLLLDWFDDLLEDTYGPDAQLKRIRCRFGSVVRIDEEVRYGGVVAAAAEVDGRHQLQLNLWVKDLDGQTRMDAHATVEIPN